MPQIFKALASITAWIMFINGVLGFAWSAIDTFARPGGVGGEPYNFSDVAWGAFAIVSLFLAVAAMRMRKALE